MRDARTLTVGEPVVLHTGEDVKKPGVFLGIFSNYGTEYLRVQVAEGELDVLPASEHVWLTDRDRNLIGIPEPVLETIPPDLE